MRVATTVSVAMPGDDGGRHFVDVLAAVLDDGLEVVEAACAEAVSSRPFQP